MLAKTQTWGHVIHAQLERFITLEMPDSLAINPNGAGVSFSLNERLRAWASVGEAMVADTAAAVTMTGLPRVGGRLRARVQNAVVPVAVSLGL
jgi:hypothetical protein